jgi:ABC-type transport system involved in cytochrome c biogenesis permease subunit
MALSLAFAITAVLYGAAAGLYLLHLARGSRSIELTAHFGLGAGVVSHVVFLVLELTRGRSEPFSDIHGTLAILSLGVVIGFLVAAARYPIPVLGAFITPVTLLLFLGSGLARGVAQVPPEVRTALLPFHVTMNVVGIAAFAVAFGASVAYVIQERMLRKKRLGGVFQRLPSLDVLDGVALRSVTIGFPLLTAGVITGTFWIVRENPGLPAFSSTQVLGLVTWLVFATVLVLRVAAGWRGRRAAVGTIMGFACAMAVLAGYVMQARAGA